MAWVFILVGGLFEVLWAIMLKQSDGFSKLLPSALFLVAVLASMALLAVGLRTLPVGPGYAVWTGIGAVGTAIAGMLFLGEASTLSRVLPIALIVVGIVWLALATGGE